MTQFGNATQQDLPEFARFIQLAFGVGIEGATDWLSTKLGLDNLRIMRGPSGPVSGLGRIPMAQFFGGRSVRMLGIAGVATPPEHRGKGHAKRMMAAAVQEATADGFPLSVLYASTQPLYRSVGYEQAGYRFVSKLPMQTLGVTERTREVIAVSDAEMPEIRACYREFAAEYSGMVDRNEYIWERVRNRRGDKFHGFAIQESGRIAGYLFACTEKPGRDRGDLAVSDIAWRTPSAARKLLGLLSDFTTMHEHVLLSGSPLHPIVALLPQQRFEIEAKEYWFLRVLRLQDAVQKRGYAAGYRASAVFEIADEFVPANGGRWKISVADGSGTCERDDSGGPTIACDIAAFAAIYSGLHTPSQARALGMVVSDVQAARAADGMFAAGTPWMTDFF